MVIAEVEVKEWGNSIGLIVPAHIVNELKIKPKDKIIIEVKKENPLKELWGFGDGKKINRKEFLKFRKEFEESKWL